MTDRIKSAVVTGAAGFLGFCIARQLVQDQAEHIYLIDDFSRGVRDRDFESLLANATVEFIEMDLTDPNGYHRIPTNVDAVFHMAALNGTQNFYGRPFDVIKSSTLPTMFLIEHFGQAASAARFVYAGSSETYATTVTRFGWPVPTAEDVPLSIGDTANPRWSYAASKLHGEIATIHGCTHFGLPFTIVRYHNAYGPRMGDKHVIPDFLLRAKVGEFSLFGGSDTRAFIYGDDAARATIQLASHDDASGATFHVGGTQEITMQELARRIMVVGDLTGDLVIHPAPAGSVARRCPDTKKARSLIGNFEQTSLSDGLAMTSRYYLA